MNGWNLMKDLYNQLKSMKMEWFCSIRLNRWTVLLCSWSIFQSIVCLSGSGFKCSRPCSRLWPSGPSARHKPRDKQKQSEGTEPRPATVPYTSHEGFSQTGGRASRRQPVITEVVRCDDSGMLIASFFFFLSEWQQNWPALLCTLRVCRRTKKCSTEGQSMRWNSYELK